LPRFEEPHGVGFLLSGPFLQVCRQMVADDTCFRLDKFELEIPSGNSIWKSLGDRWKFDRGANRDYGAHVVEVNNSCRGGISGWANYASW
jgi:hypothetical protein